MTSLAEALDSEAGPPRRFALSVGASHHVLDGWLLAAVCDRHGPWAPYVLRLYYHTDGRITTEQLLWHESRGRGDARVLVAEDFETAWRDLHEASRPHGFEAFEWAWHLVVTRWPKHTASVPDWLRHGRYAPPADAVLTPEGGLDHH